MMLPRWLEAPALRTLALYLRRSPVEKGRWRLTQQVVPWAIRLAPQLGRRTVRTRYDFRMDLDLHDFICQMVWATGEFEKHTSDLLRALLVPGDTVLDVGANVGYFTLLAARAVGPTGQVHAFEPVPDTRAELDRNVALNQFRQVVVHPEALADADGEATIFLGPASQRGIAALRPLAEQSGKLSIRTACLDRLLSGVRPVALAKIDVEGAEYRVLQGMRGCLERDRPDLVVEICDEYLQGMGASAAAVADLLAERGYRMYGMDYDGLVPMNRWTPEAPALFNALFTQRATLPMTVLVKDRWHAAAQEGSPSA